MKDIKSQKTSIFSSDQTFKFSRTALGLILATLFLAVLLTFSTLENINRAQGLMERFLLQKGETIIRAVEAALRTSLRHHMDDSGDPLNTLLVESSRENDIVFIIITDGDGRVIAQTNNAPDVDVVRSGTADALSTGESVAAIDKQTGIFTISKRLSWQSQLTSMPITEDHTRRMSKHRGTFDGSTISIGLFTEGYVNAQKQDIQHAIFMGAILFLVGSAGLYLLFLYHSVRVTRSTLANMKLYTENVNRKHSGRNRDP